MGKILLVGSLVGIMIAAVVWAGYVWLALGEAEMSADGFIALTLGVVVSIAVGVGLMALVFISARRGYDEQVEYELPDEPKS